MAARAGIDNISLCASLQSQSTGAPAPRRESASRGRCLREALHRIQNTLLTVEEGRPAAAALELGRALVQRRAAARTCVHALVVVLVVLAGACRLGALLAQDAELVGRRSAASAIRMIGRHRLGRTCWGVRTARHSLSDLVALESDMDTALVCKSRVRRVR